MIGVAECRVGLHHGHHAQTVQADSLPASLADSPGEDCLLALQAHFSVREARTRIDIRAPHLDIVAFDGGMCRNRYSHKEEKPCRRRSPKLTHRYYLLNRPLPMLTIVPLPLPAIQRLRLPPGKLGGDVAREGIERLQSERVERGLLFGLEPIIG